MRLAITRRTFSSHQVLTVELFGTEAEEDAVGSSSLSDPFLDYLG
jgi:hypothetical protein